MLSVQENQSEERPLHPTISPLDASFGAIVTDVKLAELTDASWQILEDAFHEYAMLVFPGQHLSDDEQTAFGQRFGDIEQLIPGKDYPSVPLSNQKPDGSVLTPEEHAFKVLRGNEGWHTDSTYMPLASKAALLSAVVIPPEGGETEWADMRAAYDELSDDMKERIEDLSAYHSLYYSQEQAGYVMETGTGYGYHTKGAPFRPLVKLHPVTGRKSLFVGRHAYGIPGMSEEESKELLQSLVDFSCQPPRTYQHKWQVGDLVAWDNRCLLHRARPYDVSLPRIVRATRIAGDPATELAETAADERAAGFEPSASNG